MNMSYCRFENTAKDLADCVDHWNDVPNKELSDSEVEGKARIVRLAIELLDIENYEVLQ